MGGLPVACYEADVKPRLAEIAAWCEEGVTDAEIAKVLGISANTLSKYKVMHEELAEVMYTSCMIFNSKVAHAMGQSALGFYYFEEVQELIPTGRKNPDGTLEFGFQVTKRIKKFCPPSTDMQKYWSENRDPRNWKNVKHIKVDEDKTFRVVLPEGMQIQQIDKSKEIDYNPTETQNAKVYDVPGIPIAEEVTEDK